MLEPTCAQALVNTWLAALGARAGLALRLDEEGVCGVGHVSGMDCAIEVPDGGSSVYLRAPLMAWPPRQARRIAEHCLEAQFLGLETDGASFAIDPRDSELVLWKSVPVATLDEAALASLVVGFIEAAARWRESLRRADGTQWDGVPASPLMAGV